MRKYSTAIAIIIGFVIFSSEMVLGVWMAHWHHFIPGDAISRVANAYYVEYSRDPHLAAIGFVWNPLPSLLMLPILLFKPWLPELASEGIAAVILTAMFAAGASMLLYKNLIKRKCPLWLGLFITLCFAFNPFIFLYGSNGMSEMIFIFFLMWCVTSLLDWMDDEGILSMTFMGFALALAFLTRYEAVLFGFFLSIAVALLVSRKQGTERIRMAKRTMLQKLEASEIIIFLPAVYAGVLWILLNKSIMGDALFFLHSNYSNVAETAVLKHSKDMSLVIGHWQPAILFILERSACFLIPFVAVIIMRLLRRELFHREFFSLALLVASIPVMQLYMLVKGASYGWLRFFVYPLPIVAAWLPYELQRQREKCGRVGYAAGCVIVLASLVLSAAAVGKIMQIARFSPDEYQTIHYKTSNQYQLHAISEKIAADLDKRAEANPKIKILTDSYSSFQVVLSSAHSDQFVITSDHDFKRDLASPYKKVDYILVPSPDYTANNALDAVNQRYPHLYKKGARFARLEKSYGQGWRLYQVVRPKNISK